MTEINSPVSNLEGLTLLHLAAGIQSSEVEAVVLYLLNHGANPNARTKDDGLTPVHIATMWKNCSILEKLLVFGGDPWLYDNEGKNSFDLAVEANADRCIEFLNNFEFKQNFEDVRNLCAVLDSISLYDESSTDCELSKLHRTINNSQFGIGNTKESKSNCLEKNSVISKKSQLSLTYDKQSTFLENKNFMNKPTIFPKVFFSDSENSNTLTNKSSEKSLSVQSSLGKKLLNMCSESKNGILGQNSFPEERSSTDESLCCKAASGSSASVEIIHTDDEEGITFVEQRCLSSTNDTVTNDASNSDYSTKTDWKSFQTAYQSLSSSSESSTLNTFPNIPEDLIKLNNSEIFQRLKELGDDPGPVYDITRRTYLRRLAKLKSGQTNICCLSQLKYPSEIYLYLDNKLNMARIEKLEQEISEDFDRASQKGQLKSESQRCSFNYFLLDPRITKNLPSRSCMHTLKEMFIIFLESLFYVGKGTRGRPFSHLYEAAKAINTSEKQKNDKVMHIVNIWQSGLGVISLQCFQNSVPVEALTREACIIEAIGLANLTNIKKGNFYGRAKYLTMVQKRQLGVLYISRALEIFLLEGERLIRFKDIG